MPPLIKTVLIVFIVMGCVILPFYLWNLIDRKSYEDFLLKGVSPLSRESRNEILRQRGAEPWFSRMRKKEIKERDFTYFWFKKIQPEVWRVPLRPINEQNMMSENRVKSPESDQSIQEIWWWWMRHTPSRVIWPGVFIALTVLSVNYIGDGLRDALDPRLRGRWWDELGSKLIL